MAALTILIIRHAEKPGPNQPDLGNGVTERGVDDKHCLVVRGWQRAGAWATLFGFGAFGPDYPKPSVVFAANPAIPAPGNNVASRRHHQTIQSLCDRLHIDPDLTFAVGQEELLITAVTKLTGTVLISWEHKKIPEKILPLLVGQQTIPHVPVKWSESRFDVVLRFDRPNKDAEWSFRQMFPMLMKGDSDIPLKDRD